MADGNAASHGRSRAVDLVTLLWGGALATWLTWRYFTYPPGSMHWNHEGATYVLRLIEFVDCLRAGQLFPQWASDFRGGLGGPYFGYYQPGFFYVASVFTPFLSMTAALGAALWCLSLAGFLATAALVRPRFGGAAGLLAGSALLLSPYPRIELYMRGDLSEYAGMMMLPAALYALVTWFEETHPHTWCGLAFCSGALVVLHAVVGLVGYGVLAVATVWYAVTLGAWRRGVGAVGALLLGIGLTTFYWLPVALEWSFARGDIMAAGPFHYARHFVLARQLLGWEGKRLHIPVSLGPVVPALMIVGAMLWLIRPKERRAAQGRLVMLFWVIAVVAAFLMTSPSQPVWEKLLLLQKLQFPWRLLVVVTVATAVLAGCQPAWPRVVAPVGIAALLFLVVGLKPGPLVPYTAMHTGADLRAIHFGPDGVGEWLPRGARNFANATVPQEPTCTPACESASLERGQGWLRIRLTTEQTASVVLPHYFFPAGWQVTLDGAAIELDRSPDGLMLLVVPPVRDGVIEARFYGTPMRRRGIAISAGALALWLAALANGRFRRGDASMRAVTPT